MSHNLLNTLLTIHTELSLKAVLLLNTFDELDLQGLIIIINWSRAKGDLVNPFCVYLMVPHCTDDKQPSKMCSAA